MISIDEDQRSAKRRTQDEDIAAEPQLPAPNLPPGATPSPMETLLGKARRHPVALTGIVENGVIRIVDTAVKLPEHSRVIIVAESA